MAIGRAASGSPGNGTGSSAAPGSGRTGSTSVLDPGNTVSVTGSGAGQARGQYEVENASRSRWPGGSACARALSTTRTR